LNIYELDKIGLDDQDMDQGDVYMALVNVYDHRTCYCEKNLLLKRIRINLYKRLLKSSCLNLNNCEVIQENLEVILTDSLQ
jgi:hypothetical protein